MKKISPHKLYEMAKGDKKEYIRLMAKEGWIIIKKKGRYMKKSEELREQQQAYIDAISKREDLHSEASEIQRGITERKIEMANRAMPLMREIIDLEQKKDNILDQMRAVVVPKNVSDEEVRQAEISEAAEGQKEG